MPKNHSPYLDHPMRLSDVIAAIQVLGTYPWASRHIDKWREKMGHCSTGDWLNVFTEHPEFFKISDDFISLRWRHGYDRRYDPEKELELTADALGQMTRDEKSKLSRRPLTHEQIQALLATAIEMHDRAIAHKHEKRWFVPSLFALSGVILGAILQSAFK